MGKTDAAVSIKIKYLRLEVVVPDEKLRRLLLLSWNCPSFCQTLRLCLRIWLLRGSLLALLLCLGDQRKAVRSKCIRMGLESDDDEQQKNQCYKFFVY